jgi:hypothetical protein
VAYRNAQTNVTATATQIGHFENGLPVLVQNMADGGRAPVYLGASGVTPTTGFRLDFLNNGSSITIPGDGDLYAVCDTGGTARVSFLTVA